MFVVSAGPRNISQDVEEKIQLMKLPVFFGEGDFKLWTIWGGNENEMLDFPKCGFYFYLWRMCGVVIKPTRIKKYLI